VLVQKVKHSMTYYRDSVQFSLARQVTVIYSRDFSSDIILTRKVQNVPDTKIKKGSRVRRNILLTILKII